MKQINWPLKYTNKNWALFFIAEKKMVFTKTRELLSWWFQRSMVYSKHLISFLNSEAYHFINLKCVTDEDQTSCINCGSMKIQKTALPAVISYNCRMAWVVRDLKDHIIPAPLPWGGMPSTRPGCSKPHPTWPWTLPGMEHPQLLWATCSSASPPSE